MSEPGLCFQCKSPSYALNQSSGLCVENTYIVPNCGQISAAGSCLRCHDNYSSRNGDPSLDCELLRVMHYSSEFQLLNTSNKSDVISGCAVYFQLTQNSTLCSVCRNENGNLTVLPAPANKCPSRFSSENDLKNGLMRGITPSQSLCLSEMIQLYLEIESVINYGAVKNGSDIVGCADNSRIEPHCRLYADSSGSVPVAGTNNCQICATGYGDTLNGNAPNVSAGSNGTQCLRTQPHLSGCLVYSTSSACYSCNRTGPRLGLAASLAGCYRSPSFCLKAVADNQCQECELGFYVDAVDKLCYPTKRGASMQS